jgi:hypothetical protein
MDQQHAHAVVDQAIIALLDGGVGFYADRVKERLRTIDNGEELQHAVISLASLAKLLDDAGNIGAADRVLDLACEAISPLRKFGADSLLVAQDLTRVKTARFKAFAAEETQPRAPKYGVKPKNTVALRELIPPRPRRA